jgi:hypothetical protein
LYERLWRTGAKNRLHHVEQLCVVLRIEHRTARGELHEQTACTHTDRHTRDRDAQRMG